MDWSPLPFSIFEYNSDSELANLIQNNNKHIPFHTFFFQKQFLQFPKIIRLGDAGEYNPYHFYFMMVARFRFVDDGSGIIHYYYPNTRNTYISEQGLKLLPSRFQRKTEPEANIYYFELPFLKWYTESIRDFWVYPYVRELYKHIWSSSLQIKGKYTYISRSKSGRRRLMNESEIALKLKWLGFSIYNMEDLTLEEQIRLFSNSEILCGVHSAAFANLVFCQPGTKFMEIFYDGYSHLHYVDISEQCNIKYIRYIDTKIIDSQTNDMELTNPEHFISELTKFVNP
jgi:hypothetical protein